MGLLHYESFILSYKLCITPVIGEADSDLLVDGRKSDDSLWWNTQQDLPGQLKRLASSQQAQLLICDTWEPWPLQVTGNTGKICVHVGVGKLVFDSPSYLTHINSARKCLSGKCEPHQQPAPPCNSPGAYNWIAPTHNPPTSLLHPGEPNSCLKVRVEGQKGTGVGGKITKVPHGYLNMRESPTVSTTMRLGDNEEVGGDGYHSTPTKMESFHIHFITIYNELIWDQLAPRG